MTSRDFGFLTLRNTTAYQPNGFPVPPNNIFVTSTNGAAVFSNNILISTVTVSTLNVNTENVSSINASTINASTIVVDYLTVNSTTTLSTTTINNTLAIIGNTPADSKLWLNNYNARLCTNDPNGGLYIEASTTTSIWFSNIDATVGPYAQIGQNQSAFYGSVNVTSTLTASTIKANVIDANFISTNNLATNYISTYKQFVFFDNNLSTCYLDNIGSTLYVDGQPVITEAIISTISSVFWNAGPNGSIYNKNIGNGGNNQLVYIGDNGVLGIQPQFTLDVAGSIHASTFISTNIIQMNNGLINGINIISTSQNINIYSSSFVIHPIDPTFYDSFKVELSGANFTTFKSTINSNPTTVINNSGGGPLTIGTNTQSVYINNNNVGIGTYNPQYTLDIAGSIHASTFLSTSIINMSSIGASNGQIMGLSTINGLAWPPIDDAFWSGSVSGNIWNDNSGFVGINTASPAFTLDVNGNTHTSGYLSTNIIQMSTGQLIGVSTINGLVWPPIDDALWSKTGNNIYNDNTGNVGIGTSLPGVKLDVNGSLNVNGDITMTGNSIYVNLVGTDVLIKKSTINGGDGTTVENSSGGPIIFGTILGNDTSGRNFMYIGGPSPNPKYIGINTTTPQATLDVSGDIRASTFLSTNQINMNNGHIISNSGNININGPLVISSITDPSDAGITLFNGKGTIGTNTGFDGIYIESSDNHPIYLCSTNNAQNYATFGPTTNNLNLNTLINGSLRLTTGSAVSPALFFNSDTDTGLYGIADGQMGISANGQERIRITNTDITLTHNPSSRINISSISPSNYTTLNVTNTSNISSATKLIMNAGDISYNLYTTNTQGGIDGTIPSTFQIYSYYPAGNKNVLTIYPNGDTNINGSLNVSGTATSRVATAQIVSDPGISGWATFLGKYCFVDGNTVATLTLPTNVTQDGTILVIRNIGATQAITVNTPYGGNSILAGKTTSYIYTTTVTPNGWYAL